MGLWLFSGAAVILFLLLAGALFRLLQDARFWLPALAASAVCLVIGGVWMSKAVDAVGSIAWLEDGVKEIELRVAQAPVDLEYDLDKGAFKTYPPETTG